MIERIVSRGAKKRKSKDRYGYEETHEAKDSKRDRKINDLNQSFEEVFNEGDNIVTMTAKGQDTDFTEDESTDGELPDSDDEVILNTSKVRESRSISINNNATVRDDVQPSCSRYGNSRDVDKTIVDDDNRIARQRARNIEEANQVDECLTPEATLLKVQQLMAKGGFKDTAKYLEEKMQEEIRGKHQPQKEKECHTVREKLPQGMRIVKRSGKSPQRTKTIFPEELDNNSETTIYNHAVAMHINSSSDEGN